MQYNQTGRGHVRVGNWFEELKLTEDTGVRFYPQPKTKAASLLTKTRCIEHSARTNPKEYISVTHSTLVDPKRDPGYLVVEKNGPRYKKFESTVKQEIEEKIQQQTITAFNNSRKVDYESEYKGTLNKPGFSASLKENDFSFRIPTRNSNYSTDSAITFYSHAVDKNPSDVPFPMSFVKSINPFRKNCVFSADIETEVIAARTESWERPQSLPTVREYKTLTVLRSRLIDQAKKVIQDNTSVRPYFGQAVRFLIEVFARHENDAETPISVIESDLYDNVGRYQLSPSEKYALASAYDKHTQGSIPIFDFAVLFKRTPLPRRLELIGFFYSVIDPDSFGRVSINDLRSRLSRGNQHAEAFLDFVSSASDEFTIDDFYDFYIYVSSEIESEEFFEDLMKDAWGCL